MATPATQEAATGESWFKASPGKVGETFSKTSQAWWYTAIIPAIQEVEGHSLRALGQKLEMLSEKNNNNNPKSKRTGSVAKINFVKN
jgi:hypothetical protein